MSVTQHLWDTLLNSVGFPLPHFFPKYETVTVSLNSANHLVSEFSFPSLTAKVKHFTDLSNFNK